MNENVKKGTRAESFIRFVVNRTSNDKGTAAALRKADNPTTEYQSWEHLAAFGIDLENTSERLAYGLVAAAIVKAKAVENGSKGLGNAIALSYDNGNQNNQAKSKLRRLLACDSVEELCLILRPLLQMINARLPGSLNFSLLLNQLLDFRRKHQQIKAEWAHDFYGQQIEVEKHHDS